MIPKLIRLSRSAPKDRHKAWDRYWAGITSTGPGGEVLWDSGSNHEFQGYQDSLLRYLDPALPVVDTGCGHGSFTRALAGIFPQVIGVDVSPHAVARARAESAGIANAAFEARDMTAEGAAGQLAESFQSNELPSGANVKDLFSGETVGQVDDLHSFFLELPAYGGTALILAEAPEPEAEA